MIGLAPAPGPLEVLCLGAHPDDVEIGCGGTLLGWRRAPRPHVSTVVLTGTPERQVEAERAAASSSPGAKRHDAGPAGQPAAGALG